MQNKTDPDNLFKPTNFYNLNGAGLGVWLLCLVISSVFPGITSFQFRIIALSLSLLVALAFLFKSKKQGKFEYQLLVLFNAGLVFVNASGYNTITYNIPFERKKFHSTDSLPGGLKTAGFFSFLDQKDWWPDKKMIYESDSLKSTIIFQNRKIQTLEYQIGFLRDWMQGAIKPSKQSEYNQIRNSIGLVEYDSLDIAILGSSHSNQVQLLNRQVDDLKFQIKMKEMQISLNEIESMSRIQYEVDGKFISAQDYVDTLHKKDYARQMEIINLQSEIRGLKNKLNAARSMLRIPVSRFDSLMNYKQD